MQNEDIEKKNLPEQERDLPEIADAAKKLPSTDEEIQKSKRGFGLGIYGDKKRISLHLLDGFIAILIICIIAIMIVFSRDGGYEVRFETDIPGMEIETQDVGYGKKVTEPSEPELPGYKFEGWYLENGYRWDFQTDTVGNDIVLHAKFSLDIP